MRFLATAILAGGMAAAIMPAQAQTFPPDYPVCLHVYGRANYYDCRYTSLEQCAATAQGQPAQCELNPYAVRVQRPPAAVRQRRPPHPG